MTKKRFKQSMTALGLLLAFCMVLVAVLLAPTLASAGKDAGASHRHGGMPDVGYIPDGSGGAPHGLAENWNESGHDHGNAYDAPFCVDGGVYPCTIFGDTDDAFDGAGSDHDSYENGYPGGGNPQGGDGSSNNNGRYSPNFWGGGGGGPGGGNGAGDNAKSTPCDSEQDGSDADNKNSNKDDVCNKDSDDQETDGNDSGKDTEVTLLPLTPPGDDQSSDFVDPTFGDNDPKSEDGPKDGPQGPQGPKGENPPITEIAVTEVPEPLTLSLFAVGLVGAASLRRRSRKV